MLKERLDPCATLLYHWIRCHETETGSFDLNLENFQVWTSEFLEETASLKEVDHALLRLMQLQLIRVETDGIITVPLDHQPRIALEPLPRKFWKMFHWQQRLTISVHQINANQVAIAAVLGLLTLGLILVNPAPQSNPITPGDRLEQSR